VYTEKERSLRVAKIGYIVQEKYGDHLINEYACASKVIAAKLILTCNSKRKTLLFYKVFEHEFTDSEFINTIGYFSTLNEDQEKKELFVNYGS
jgi:hypothetical protein